VLCKYNKYPTTKVNNKVIVHIYLPAQIPLTDFKWRMAIFIVILANHSYGSCYYKSWMIPVSGQDSDKLAEKFVKKGPMKIQHKANRALEMMQRMKIGGVGGV
jgi:hypothetical protein